MTPFIRPLTVLLIAGATALSPLHLAAQDNGDPPVETTDLPEMAVEMAAIERAWAAGDFVTVRQGLKVLAEQDGTPLAQYRYGRILIEGRGGPHDPKGAVLWLDKAVQQNHAQAATLLARIYLSDVPDGPGRDAAKAADLLTRAATRGDAPAQYLLGLLYQAGEGVEQDNELAFNWLLAAAEQQHAMAQFALSALLFEQGEQEDGLGWLRAAAGEGVTEAQVQLAVLLDDPESGATNRTEALDWFRRAAESGHALAQRRLGTRFLQGDGVRADPQEALRWLTSAAQAGDPGAMSNLGYAFARGEGVAQDLEVAARWYAMGAEYGLGRAMVALARQLETGAGVPEDFETALTWYTRALETTDAGLARVELGRLAVAGRLDGRAAPQRAVPWVLAAAKAGNDAAQDWLGAQALEGNVAAQSAWGRHLFLTDTARRPEAIDLLRTAADNADAAAQFALAGILARGEQADGTPDYVQAHKWYNVAATFGHPKAADQREILGNLMTPDQIAAAQTAARIWFETDALRPVADQ